MSVLPLSTSSSSWTNASTRPRNVLSQRISSNTLLVWLVASNFLIVFVTLVRHHSGTRNNEHLLLASSSSLEVMPRSTAIADMDEYSLAREQSGGFLDDISNADWIQFYQRPARTYQPYRFADEPNTDADKVPFWIFHNWDAYFACPRARRIGGKWICDPDRLVHYHQHNSTTSCLIYHVVSSGSNQQETVEWITGAALYFGNACEIHVFGATSSAASTIIAQDNHISFHDVTVFEEAENNHSNPLSRVQERLGHAHRSLDILSLDCQGCEWTWFPAVLAAAPRQVLVQTHDLPLANQAKETAKFGTLPRLAASNFFYAFRNAGFVLYAKEVLSATEECLETNWSFLRLERGFWEASN